LNFLKEIKNMKKSFFPANLDIKIAEAINFFWKIRSQQLVHSDLDHGNRGAVTGGKQLDGFINLLKELLLFNEVPESCIYTRSHLELPGFYRPTKEWDLLVVNENQLVIAVELKSQVGPSFGNNFNNRTEEALGSALDLWTAFREGVFGGQPTPWLGYFLLLEDCVKSTNPVNVKSPHFEVMPEFANASYKNRYEIFCSKLLRERQYNAVCFLTSQNAGLGGTFQCPNEALSYKSFLASMAAAVITHFSCEGK